MSQPSRSRRKQAISAALLLLSLISFLQLVAGETRPEDPNLSNLAWSTDVTGPRRFVSVHGRRAAVFGYSQDASPGYPEEGLEIWAYPVQILSSYRVAFRQAGQASTIDGQTILRRILYSPEAVTRIYVGPDFVIRERIFVPLDEPGAIIAYEVDGEQAVDIEVRFTPVLDLMWPASIGGQETKWDSAASSYLITELTHRYTASVGSPDVVSHDDTGNISKQVHRGAGLAFTIRPESGGHKVGRVFIAGAGRGQEIAAVVKKLLVESDSSQKDAIEHYSDLLRHAVQIETPDAETTRALAWSEIAMDQAWVCNPDLGCGVVAGYGPSRKARRPQYDWFFAGDGMVAIEGLLAAGEYKRARDELEFILKYQDKKTGMIWHEMSQSAGQIDWAKYPYMFVHVDVTFQFLSSVGHYFSVTGDRQFLQAHWAAIESAYDYCRSTLNPEDGLPRIPADKEGSREQDALSEELTLSASWVSSAQAFAQLAAATGHASEAAKAREASNAARGAIPKRYWDESRHLWITGYTRANKPLISSDVGAARIVGEIAIPAAQRNALFDQIASSDFQADWGTRGNASSASTYRPNSYASGSVWASATAGIATSFWREHRPSTALPIWKALIPWSALDSVGHMHEALAGDFYHEELESVPEQTWSSSSFFTAAMHGLLGLEIEAASNLIKFSPHLPPDWNTVTIRNLTVGSSEINLTIVQSADKMRLQVHNSGGPVEMLFDPEIPLGAKLKLVHLGDRLIPATLEQNTQDTHASVKFTLPNGNTLLTIAYAGGVVLITNPPQLWIGDASRALKIVRENLKDQTYTVEFDYVPSETNSFELRTNWKIEEAEGATFDPISPSIYRVTISAHPDRAYQRGKVAITFAR
jgi:glycogen debranching enzyme